MSDRDSVVTVDELNDLDDRGHGRPHESQRGEGNFKRDSGRNESSFGIQDLASKVLQIQSKRYYLDIKQNKRGRFLKLSEVEGTGMKNRLTMDMAAVAEFHDQLTEFSEHYASLGPRGSRGDKDGGKLKSETIYSGDRRYYLDLKENARGRFLKVSMTLPPPSHERQQIIIPAQGMIDIRDNLTDLLSEFGGQSQAAAAGGANPDVGSGGDASAVAANNDKLSLSTERKKFFFDVLNNRRGTYLRISELSSNFRTAINVPEEAWGQFVGLLRSSTRPDKKIISDPKMEEDISMIINDD